MHTKCHHTSWGEEGPDDLCHHYGYDANVDYEEYHQKCYQQHMNMGAGYYKLRPQGAYIQ